MSNPKASKQKSVASNDYTRFSSQNLQLRRLDLNLLLIFTSIGRHRKLSDAADELNITKSAISHALTRLRDIFKDPLFIRGHNGVQLTPRATTLLPRIASIIELSHDVLALEQSFDTSTETRVLRIGCVEYVEALIAPTLTCTCLLEAPHMKLVFVPMTRSDMIDAISSYKVDLGLGSYIGEASGLDVEAMRQDEYVVVSRSEHYGQSRAMTRERYLAANHVSISSESHPQRIIESIMTTEGVSRHISALVPHYNSAFRIVANSDCLLTIPRLLAVQMAEQLKLTISPFPFSSQKQTISLLSPILARHDPALQWLIHKCRHSIDKLGD